MALITIQQLVKTYDAGKPNAFQALRGIDLLIEKGDFIAIMGVSGSGKSTLMHIIGCLDQPTSGTFFLDNNDIGMKKPRDLVKIRREKIGFIFQNFNLLPRRTAMANVELPLIYQGVRPRVRHEKAKAALDQVGLGEKYAHQPNMLSGGEQQRVAIARALINDPDIILADEPTGNLDTASGQSVMEVLRRLNRQGKTIIIVTHDPSIARLAKRTINIKDGLIS
ncbi:MAG: ABC transporter ATP-binding protein [Patescibacteria group bacterium]